MSPPALRIARTLHAFRALGAIADDLDWWRPGLPLVDGVTRWEQVTGRSLSEPEPLRPFDRLELAA